MEESQINNVREYLDKLDQCLNAGTYDHMTLQNELPRVIVKIQYLTNKAYLSDDLSMKTQYTNLEQKARNLLDIIEYLYKQTRP
jgi:hypothetical protein